MSKPIDVDIILKRAEPLVHQQAPEIQPYGHLIRMLIALSNRVEREALKWMDQQELGIKPIFVITSLRSARCSHGFVPVWP